MEVVPTTTREAMEVIKDKGHLVTTDQAITGEIAEETTTRNQSTTTVRNTVSHPVALLTKQQIYQVVLLFRKTSTLRTKKQKIDHRKKSMSTWQRIRSEPMVRMYQDLFLSLMSHHSQSISLTSCIVSRTLSDPQLSRVRLGQLLFKAEISSELHRLGVERHSHSCYQELCISWHKQW